MPQCGFSAQVVQILDASARPRTSTFCGLAPRRDQGVLAVADIPQLYVGRVRRRPRHRPRDAESRRADGDVRRRRHRLRQGEAAQRRRPALFHLVVRRSSARRQKHSVPCLSSRGSSFAGAYPGSEPRNTTYLRSERDTPYTSARVRPGRHSNSRISPYVRSTRARSDFPRRSFQARPRALDFKCVRLAGTNEAVRCLGKEEGGQAD